MSTSVGQAVLALIESDLVAVGGTPLVTLLTNLQKDAGNVLAQQADILAFTAAAPKLGITLGLQVEQQLIALAIDKLQKELAAKLHTAQAAPPPAADAAQMATKPIA